MINNKRNEICRNINQIKIDIVYTNQKRKLMIVSCVISFLVSIVSFIIGHNILCIITVAIGITCIVMAARFSSFANELEVQKTALAKNIDEIDENNKNNKKELIDKLQLKYEIVNEIQNEKENVRVVIGTIKDRLYIFPETIEQAISDYANGVFIESGKTDIDSFLKKIDRFSLNKNNLEYYYKDGDIQYTTTITGGTVKGGGSSISGAIIGGILAGSTGAIIGSRQKIESEEIKTIENKHDSRVSIVCYKNEESIITRKFVGFEVYSILLNYFPNKDLLYIQTHKAESNMMTGNTVDVESRLRKIKNLYDKGLIQEDEYEAKKKEIIDSL